MTFKPSRAGLALAGAAAMLAGAARAQPPGAPGGWTAGEPPAAAAALASAPPIAPAADRSSDGATGPEAREAFGPTGDPAPTAGTLNAQYAALQTQAEAPPPAAQAPLPQPPDAQPSVAQPSVALARRVVESAQAFVGYMQRASAVRPAWTDAPGVAHALETGGVYEPGEIEEGAVAYAALAALQDPMFVQSVRDVGPDESLRRALAGRLVANPAMILRAPGAHAAGLRASAALGRLGLALYQSGVAVKQSAYDVQHAAWSRTALVEPQTALLRLKARSAAREALGEDGGRTLLTSLSTLRGDGEIGAEQRISPVVQRGLTLAALAVLDQAGENQSEALLPILAEANSAQCVKMARLNLYQCLSVAGPQYEDIFCLGQHAMMETARCVIDASGWSPPEAAADPGQRVPAPARAMPVQAASIYVPVAFAPAARPAASYAVAVQTASAGR